MKLKNIFLISLFSFSALAYSQNEVSLFEVFWEKEGAKVDIKKAEELIKKGADINEFNGDNGMTPLIWAVSAKHSEFAKWLIGKGADINADNQGADGYPIYNSVLMEAIKADETEIAKLLIEKGVELNKENLFARTALDYAKEKGNKEIEALLREKGAKEGQNYGEFFEACALGGVATVEKALKTFGDINFKLFVFGDLGHNCIDCALSYNNDEVLKFVIEKGAEVSGNNFFNIKDNLSENVELLIKHGADVNAKNSIAGHSVFMDIMLNPALEGDEGFKSLELLIKAGADINAKNTEGKTALDLAKEYDMEELVKFLESKGAK